MNANHHRVLAERHRNLDDEIKSEEHRPLPNDVKLRELKRKKLLIKQQLEGIKA